MSDRRRVYADYNATAPLRDAVKGVVIEAMGLVGNPSAIHGEAVAARYAVEKARRMIAKAIAAPAPECVVFTSGGSESNNFALKGIAAVPRENGRKPHFIVTAAEHKAVLDAARQLERLGRIELTIVGVDAEARVRADDLRAALRGDTALVSIILANNEVGSINSIRELVKIVRENSSAIFHTDAVQALGRIPVSVRDLNVDLMTVSAHKVGGPKGVGALYIRDGVQLEPLISGGGQESHLRAGTENIPAIVGFAHAVALAVEEIPRELARQVVLREMLWEELRETFPTAVRNTPITHSLPNTLNFSLPGRESRRMIALLDEAGVACSAGSACTSNDPEPSHVLKAMGLAEEVVSSAIRLSFGPATTDDDIASVARAFQSLPQDS